MTMTPETVLTITEIGCGIALFLTGVSGFFTAPRARMSLQAWISTALMVAGVALYLWGLS